MFEKATREKLRFVTTRGLISTEDLWDLPLESVTNPSLDKVAIELSDQIAKTVAKSFVRANKKDDILDMKLEIVKHIISVKIEEAAQRKLAANNKERKELLLDVLAEKQTDELKQKSAKEIEKEIKKLEKT